VSHIDVIEALRGRIQQLESELHDHRNLICLMVNKFGSPVIITRREVGDMPPEGTLSVMTDKETESILLAFTTETSVDTEKDQTQKPQGSGEGEGE